MMYDQSINKNILNRFLFNSDFEKGENHYERREELISLALKHLKNNNLSPTVDIVDFKGKDLFQIKEEGINILQRRVTHTLKTLHRVHVEDRNKIIRRLKLLLEDDAPFKVYRLDIKNFYESVDIIPFLKELDDNPIFTRESVSIVKEILSFDNHNGGLPRGFSISSIISEIILRSFDKSIRNNKDVIFFSRFVDDILIISSDTDNKIIEFVESNLPEPLKLNVDKQTILDFENVRKEKGKIQTIDYLGYSLSVNTKKKKGGRCVTIDISPKKVKKIQSRIIHSIIDFNKSFDASSKKHEREECFEVLKDRIKFLTGNFSFADYKSSERRNSGIYFNYHLVDINESQGLKQLDKFLIRGMKGKGSYVFGCFRSRLNRSKTLKGKCRELSTFSFYQGFSKITFHHFTSFRLNLIQRCWKYAK